MKLTFITLLCLGVVALAAPAAAAGEPAAEASSVSAQTAQAKSCTRIATEAATEVSDDPAGTPLRLFIGDPVQQTCSVQIECSDGSVIGCNGNNTCSTSSDGRCTICDGVTTACCAQTCCEVCQDELDTCTLHCSTPSECRACNQAYTDCISGCTGGCL